MILHNFPSYIKRPSSYTIDEIDMGLSTVSFPVKLEKEIDPNFKLDWAVVIDNKRYVLDSLLPSGMKDNNSLLYKYDLTFKSEESILSHYPFLNMVELGDGNNMPNQSTFAFQGSPKEFIDRFNLNLTYYLGNTWIMKYVGLEPLQPDRVTISVDNSSLWDMLTQFYDLYKIRWTIKGKVIEVGALAEEVEHIFEYGAKKGLYSISRSTNTEAIYTRLIGQGSQRNLPPNYFKEGDPDTNGIIKLMHFTGLMPSGYRDYIRGWNAGKTNAAENSDYNAGATDKLAGKKMQPINYVENNVDKWGVRYGSVSPNETIYPTIQGMERAGLGRIDEVVAVSTIDDSIDPVEPTFSVWIKDLGFDLRDEKYWVSDRMTMMFSDGLLAGEDYEFELVATEREDGKLIPHIYPDASKSHEGVKSAWRVELFKSEAELDASGRYLPNQMQNAKAGDHFFLINIALPHEYVLAAEKRVTNWLNEEVARSSDEFPTYSIRPSSIFLHDFSERNKMNCGSKLRIRDERLVGDTYLPIYIQSKRTVYSEGKMLPSVELVVSDKVIATRNPLQLLQSSVQLLSSGTYSSQQIAEFTKQMEKFFLRKDISDIARRIITFMQGMNVGEFSSGMLGGGGTFRMQDGKSVLEVDQLLVRMRAEFFSVLIHNARHIGGELIISAANMLCIRVEDKGSFVRCFFDTDDGKVVNLFSNKDFARCQVFSGSEQKFYWRRVIAVGTDYIDLSNTDMVAGSDEVAVGDNIFQLGSLDPERQSAMVFSSVGHDSPSFKQYKGINSMSLAGKEYTVFSGKGNKIVGETVFMKDGSNLDNWGDGIIGDISDAQTDADRAQREAEDAMQAAQDAVADYNQKIAGLQDQIDGKIDNWFYPYTPTLSNYPASEWVTLEQKEAHIGDTFTNTASLPAENAGVSWRFVSKSGGGFEWLQIADNDAILALQKAAEAQATADGKSTTYLVQPTKYDLGDMWILNVDRTIDGKAYKNGDVLTAIVGRDVFNEKDWTKKIRYTDNTAVDELQIGGVNYMGALNSNYQPNGVSCTFQGKYYVEMSNIRQDGESPYVFFRNIYVKEKGEYTISFFAKKNNEESVSLRFGLRSSGSSDFSRTLTNEWVHIQQAFNITEVSNVRLIVFTNDYKNQYSIEIKDVMLEQGNKPTSWSPSPEDIQAEINKAQAAADKSQQDADKANGVLAEIANDNKFVPSEKQSTLLEWETIKSEYTKNVQQANRFTVSSAAYTSAYNTLSAYITPLLASVGTTSDIVGSTFRTMFKAYYDSRTDLLNAISEKAKDLADKAQEDADNAQGVGEEALGKANAAQAAADNSQQDANKANAILADIADDNKLTPSEKQQALLEWETIKEEFPKNTQHGENIGADLADYDQAFNELYDYITPLLASMNTVSSIVGSVFRSKFVNYYNERTSYLNDIAALISQVADNAWTQANALKYLSQALNKSTEINGGLVLTSFVAARDNNGVVRSYMNGEPTINPVAFAAGVSGFGGVNEKQAIALNHDGSGHLANGMVRWGADGNPIIEGIVTAVGGRIGVLAIETSGNVAMYDPSSGVKRLEFTTENLPTIPDLMSGTSDSGSVNVASGQSAETRVLAVANVSLGEGELHISEFGGIINGTGSAVSHGGGMIEVSRFSTNFILRLNGVNVKYISSNNMDFEDTATQSFSRGYHVPSSIVKIDRAGKYELVLEIETDGNVTRHDATYGSFSVSWNSTLAGVKKQQYGLNGMMFFYSNNHFYFTEDGGLDVRGKSNMPGILASGSISTSGVVSNKFGDKVGNGSTISGGYRISLNNLNHNQYTVMVTPHSNNGNPRVGIKTNTYFEIMVAGGAEFTVIGNNYP